MAKVLGEDSLVAIREWVNDKVEELEEYTIDQIEANAITIDSAMSSSSTNPVQNAVVKSYVDAQIEANAVTIDSTMSSTSTNPVQNKVLRSYINERTSTTTYIAHDLTKPVQSKAIAAALDQKANAVGFVPDLIAGYSEDVISEDYIVDNAAYYYRKAGGDCDLQTGKVSIAYVGGTIVWNQLVNTNTTSVTIPSGHKYLARLSMVWTIGVSDGNAITVSGSERDMLIDLTKMVGTEVADYVYSIDTATAGDGMKWLNKYFGITRGPMVYANQNDASSKRMYYSYNSGTFCGSGPNEVRYRMISGLNQWRELTELGTFYSDGTPCADSTRLRSSNYSICWPDIDYYVRGAVTIYWYNANGDFVSSDEVENETVTSPSDAYRFEVGFPEGYGQDGDSSAEPEYMNDVCINFSDPAFNGTYESYRNPILYDAKRTDDGSDTYYRFSLIGSLHVDTNGKLYYDGDVYEPNGTITRKYGSRSYVAGDESDPTVITNGQSTMYLLATPEVTTTFVGFDEEQAVFKYGGEMTWDSGTTTSSVYPPVGIITKYYKSIRQKVDSIPNLPNQAGTYKLSVTIGASGELEYNWVLDS